MSKKNRSRRTRQLDTFHTMTELQKIAAKAYPRYDGETIMRKTRKVMGYYRLGEMHPTEEQFEEIMHECAKEYRMRGILLISAACMERLEENAHNQTVLWPRNAKAVNDYLMPIVRKMVFNRERLDAPREDAPPVV